MAALTDTFGVRYLPHVWGSAVGLTAALQFSAALPPATTALYPSEPLFEFDRTPNLLRDELAREPIRPLDGWVAIPDRPGLGVTIDEALLERYLVRPPGAPR